jgi:hypothetical protein
MSIQNRISLTLSPRMRKALDLVAGLDGSTTATYATQLLSSAIKSEINANSVLYEKWLQLEKQAMEHETWDDVVSPMIIPSEERLAAQVSHKGWFLSGDNPDGYVIGKDTALTYKKTSSGFICSKRDAVSGFGTIMQQTDITNYVGKKLRLSAAIKTEGVKNWAGLWVRLDDKNSQCLWFDNMQNRPIKGTADWKKFKIEYEVPKESATLNFGVLLVGSGSVWINDVSLVEVNGNKTNSLEDLSVTLDF